MPAGEKMQGKRKGSNRARNAIIFAFVIIFLIVVMAATFKLNQAENPKELADEYFEIFDAQYLGTFAYEGRLLQLSELRFKIRAVKGDANNVYVLSGQSDWELVATNIPKGQYANAYISFTRSYGIPLEEGVFQVPVEISCSEAYGRILLNFTKD